MNMQINIEHKQKGFSLIEALVAFLILSVGMLGIASLQTMSLKSGHTAAMRTVAVMKVEEILESMRSNPSILMSYAAGTADMGVDNGCSQTTVPAATCTPALMAQDELFRWKNSLIEALPNNTATTASVVVTPPVAPSTLNLVVVSVNWSERNVETGSAANMTYSVAVQMYSARLQIMMNIRCRPGSENQALSEANHL